MAAAVAATNDGTMPSPPPPARCRSPLALAVGDAVLCLCLADLWLAAAAVAARDIGRVACGEECSRLVSAAASVASVSGKLTLGVLVGTFLLFYSRMVDPDSKVQGAAVRRKFQAALREVMPAAMVLMMATGFFSFLMIAVVGGLLMDHSAVKGSAMDKIGSVLRVVGILGMDVLSCFVIIPIVAERLWRITRPGWRCSAAT